MKKIKIQRADFNEKMFMGSIVRNLEPYYDIELSEQPDFLFYSVYGSGIDHYKYENCVKIFFAAEGVLPDFNDCDYAIASYPMSVGERYLRKTYNVITPEVQDRKRFENIDPDKRKFCNFIYSNESNGKGAKLRKDFCKQLMKYKRVDCPGKVLNNMKDAIEPRGGNWYSGKLEFIQDYKFTIAFENASMPGMTTEKLIQPLQAGSIPIYWGDPLVSEIFNDKAFINCNKFDSWEDVINKIIELDNDNEKYMEMLLQPALIVGDEVINTDQRIQRFLRQIIEKGNHPFERYPLGYDRGRELYLEHLKVEKSLLGKVFSVGRQTEKSYAKYKSKFVKIFDERSNRRKEAF